MFGLKREIDQIAKDKGIDRAEIIARHPPRAPIDAELPRELVVRNDDPGLDEHLRRLDVGGGNRAEEQDQEREKSEGDPTCGHGCLLRADV